MKSIFLMTSFSLMLSPFLCAVFVNNIADTVNVGVTPTGMAITPDGAYLYVANNNNYGIIGMDSVTVIDIATNLVVTTIFDDSFDQPYTITINPVGTKAYVTNSNSTTVTIITIATNTVTGIIDGFDGPSGMAINSNGSIGYVNNYGAGHPATSGNGTTVRVVDLVNNVILGSAITVGQAPAALAITSDDAHVYTVNYVDGNLGTGTMSIIDTNNNSVTTVSTGFSGPFAIAITLNDAFAYVTNFGSNNFAPFGTTVSIVDLSDNSVDTINLFSIQPAGIAITPDGKYAYVSNYNTLYAVGSPSFTDLTPGQGTVSIIDIATNTVLEPTIAVGQSPANIAITPNGQFAYVSNYISNTVDVIALPTFKIVAQGSQIQNRYVNRIQLVNMLTWSVTGTSLPVSYSIYRDEQLTDLVGTILATESLIFLDYGVLPNTTYTYYIVGTNEVGTTSAPVTVVI